MPEGRITLRERILKCVDEIPGITAVGVHKELMRSRTANSTQGNYIASQLYKFVQEEKLVRVDGGGPRGGYSYYTVERVIENKKKLPDAWEMLDQGGLDV
jgi:hypothetical protein